jgi:hypothetical protein
MTWHPLQAALKMSTLPGAIRATLDVLLDHINPATDDPTRPDTLTVWESRELLAAETGFSEVTIRDHLKRLRGDKDLAKGQRVMVLKCTAEARSHRAARYDLLPAALDALTDPARLEAFEAHPPRAEHPYHRWRQWRATQMTPTAVGESGLPQAEVTVGGSPLPPDPPVGESGLPQLGQAPSPELSQVDQREEELTTTPTTVVQSTRQANDRSPATAPTPSAPPTPLIRTYPCGVYGCERRTCVHVQTCPYHGPCPTCQAGGLILAHDQS